MVREGYKQTAIGLIPEDWEVKNFSDLCLLQRGFDITESTRRAGNVPVYSSSGLAYFHDEAKVYPPGVVTGRKGILGKVFYVEEPFWAHDTTLWVKDFRGNDAKYVSFFLTYFNLERFDAATSVPTLNRNNLVGIPIAIPPTTEQRSIAQALSDVDALIAGLDKAIDKKRAIKTATMQQLLTGKKRLPGFKEGKGYRETEIGKIPEDWNICTIKTTMLLINGCAFKPKDWKTEGTPIIRIQNLNDPAASYNYYDAEVEEKYYVNPGDILFAWSGTKESSFGARVWQGEKAILNQHIFRVVPNVDKLTSHYTLLALKRFQEDIEKKSHGFKSSFVHIKKSDLENTELVIPALAEQKAIATVLSDMDIEIATLETRLAKTQAIKQGMMQELLTGRTRLV
jgi:type I restriction enzyme, S subunit